MSEGAVTALPADSRLPALERALDPAAMAPVLARAGGHSLDNLRVTVDVLKHVPGTRCTVRYELESPGYRSRVIGKLFHSKRRARRVQAVIAALHVAFRHIPTLAVPRAALHQELRLVLQEDVEAPDIREALLRGDLTPVELAAHWLARAHGAAVPEGLKVMSVEHEMEKLDRWREAVMLHLDRAGAQALEETRGVLGRLSASCSAYEPALIHKDYYYAHVLWGSGRATVIDFDQACAGDPAFDVGHFCAHLHNLAYRRTGDATALDDAAALFVAEYENARGRVDQARLALYRAYTFLKLAATEVERRREGWQQRMTELTRLAGMEVPETSAKRR